MPACASSAGSLTLAKPVMASLDSDPLVAAQHPVYEKVSVAGCLLAEERVEG